MRSRRRCCYDVDLGECLIDCLILLHQRVLRADVAAADKEKNNDEKSHYTKHNP